MQNDAIKSQKKWIEWYPEKIYFKKIPDDITYFHSHDQLKESDFFGFLNDSEKFKQEKKEEIHIKELIQNNKKQAYKQGWEQSELESQKKYIILKNKVESLCIEFEKTLFSLEDRLCSHLLKIILQISSYVINKQTHVNEIKQTHVNEIDILSKIKDIIKKNQFLKKPSIMVHPNHKEIVEKNFQNIFDDYQWKIEYDESIDINGFKIHTNNQDLDSTIEARWQELCRLIYSEDYK